MPKTRNIDEIIPSPNFIKRKIDKDKVYPVLGLDTETDNGAASLIANSDNKVLICRNIEDILSFLLTEKHKDSINFFYNLKYDAQAIIKRLPAENFRELKAYDNTVYYSNKRGPVKFSYIPRKCLTISRIKHDKENNKFRIRDASYKFFDIAHFYQIDDDEIYGLVNTYNYIFPKKKYVKLVDAAIRKDFKPDDISDLDKQYCIEDARACQELASNIVSMTNDFTKIRNFYSSASIAKGVITSHLVEEYRYTKKKQDSIWGYALKAFSGGRFENMIRGYFPKLYNADIVSAYPSIVNTLNLTDGLEIFNKEYEDDASYSFYNIKVDIDDNKIISPLKYYQGKRDRLIYPIGKYNEVYIDKSEYDLLETMGYKPEILGAWHMFNDEERPAYPWVKDLFNKRAEFKGQKDRREYIIKILLNSIYGVTIQTTKKFKRSFDTGGMDDDTDAIEELPYCDNCGEELYGEETLTRCPKCGGIVNIIFRLEQLFAGQFFNPIQAATITSRIRSKIFLDSVKAGHELDTVLYATDGILFEKKPTHLKNSKELGEWEIPNNSYEGVILGSGIYTLWNDTEHKTRFRGFVKEKKIKELDEDNKISSLLKKLQENQDKNKLVFHKTKVTGIKESRNINDMNKFITIDKKLDINFDTRRRWEYKPKTYGELLKNRIESRPLRI